MTPSSSVPILVALVRMDARRRYLGTSLGVVWAFIAPLITTALIYFVFTFGLRAGNIGDAPYFLWLAPGLLAWFYLSDAINGGSFAVVDNAHFVTKMKFPIHLLPIVKVISPLLVHVALVSVLAVYAVVIHPRSIGTIPYLLYFGLYASVLSLGISYLTSSLVVFVRDVPNFLGVVLQFLFWATPILWSPSMLDGSRFRFLLANPLNYVVSGYRDAFSGDLRLLEHPAVDLAFWIFAIGVLIMGRRIFDRLRPHFADLL